MNEKQLNEYAEILKALGHPVRLKLVMGLMCNECNVGQIVTKLGLPQPTVSQHLAILKNRGILVPQRQGTQICYRVMNPKIAKLIEELKK